MSSIVDRFQDPIFIASVVIAAVASLAFRFLAETSWAVSAILGALIGGALFVLYQDFVEKRKLEDQEKAKQQDLQRRIKQQAEEEQKIGKCVSCTADLPEGAEECPNCGFAVKHYSNA